MLRQLKVQLVGNQGDFTSLIPSKRLCLSSVSDVEAATPEYILHLVNSMIQEDFLYILAHSIHLLPFEGRKDSQAIFSTSYASDLRTAQPNYPPLWPT